MPFLDNREPRSSRIIDIRSDSTGVGLKQQILDGITTTNGQEKTLPTLLLYDNKGLKLFEDITYLDEYYLTNEEIDLLRANAADIAEKIPDNAIVVELGSGNLRKVKLLLDAFDQAGKSITYYALDLMRSELERTLELVPIGTFHKVSCYGLHGTYDDGLEWLKRPENRGKPKLIMSLGSSIGNFTRDEAVGFLSQFVNILSPRDRFLLAIDACSDAGRVHTAYNDPIGVTHRFTLNGLDHANKLLGHEAFSRDAWEAVGEYDSVGNRHRAFVKPTKDGVEVEGVSFARGEMVRIEESYKYSPEQSSALFASAGVVETAVWRNGNASYGNRIPQLTRGIPAPHPHMHSHSATPRQGKSTNTR
jgi:EasF-like predicted methyltransferase